MGNPNESQTRVTLLGRLAQSGEPDQAAWEEFVGHYGRKVYQWCLGWHLQAADAEDVTQAVLLKLACRMKEFRYDPAGSFRAWLKTVAHHAWRDFVDGRKRAVPGQGTDDAVLLLESVAAREDLARRLDEQVDTEFRDRAMQTVARRVAAHHLRAS